MITIPGIERIREIDIYAYVTRFILALYLITFHNDPQKNVINHFILHLIEKQINSEGNNVRGSGVKPLFSGVSPFNWGLTEVEDDDESKPRDRENKGGEGTNYPILNGIIRVSLSQLHRPNSFSQQSRSSEENNSLN